MSVIQPRNRTPHRVPVVRVFALLLVALGFAASPVCAQLSILPPAAQQGNGANPQTQTANPYQVNGPNGIVQGQMPATNLSAMPGSMNGGGMQSLSPQNGAVLYPDPNQYVLSPGDLLSVRLFGVPDYSSTVRISKDGSVQLPLIGSINLGGITLRQGQDLIASALKNGGMFRNPEVILGIAESASPSTIAFAGEKSGLIVVQGQRSLLDVIAAAGGLPNSAGRTLSIIRPGVEAPIVVNLGNSPQEIVKANIPVFPRDTIFVERAGSVYMLGAFRAQGAYAIPPSGISLMQAASVAGGSTYAGKYADLRIVRTTGTERTEVKVDIKRIQYGLDPDPLLEAGDIVFLPTAPLKQAISSNGIGTLLGVISVLLIAIYPR